MREQKTKPAAPDDRLEEFMLWAQADDTPRGFPMGIVLASAAVVCIVAAVAIAGWL